MKFDIIVTRHQGLLDFLTEEGHQWNEVISHVSDPSILDGKHVLGVLPVNLAARCASFTELALGLPAEMRGKELTKDQTREFSLGLSTFVVQKVS